MDGDHLGLSIGVGRKIPDLAPLISRGQLVELVTRDAGDCEAFYIGRSSRTIAIDHVVDGPLILFLKDSHMDDPFTHEGLGIDLGHHHPTILGKNNDVVNIAAIGHVFVPSHTGTHEPFFPVHIELGIANDHLGLLYILEYPDLCLAFFPGSVFFLQPFKMGDGIFDKVGQVVFDLLCNTFADAIEQGYMAISVDIEINDPDMSFKRNGVAGRLKREAK